MQDEMGSELDSTNIPGHKRMRRKWDVWSVSTNDDRFIDVLARSVVHSVNFGWQAQSMVSPSSTLQSLTVYEALEEEEKEIAS